MGLGGGRGAVGDDFPNRPIRMIVPFPAGGPTDIVARVIGQKMSEDWGQPVVIENRPGANTLIGAQAAAKAAPDGYTLFMAIDSTLVMNQYLYKSLPYDPLNDFAPITLTAKTISVLTVAASGPKTRARTDRAGQGAAGQAQLRRRHHHGATDGSSVPQGGRARHRLCAVQGHAGDRQRAADRQRPAHLRRQPDRGAADRERPGAGARQARPRRSAVHGRHPAACRRCRPARSRRHLGLARAGCAQGHAQADHRQDPRRGREDAERSRQRRRNPNAPAIIPSPARPSNSPPSSARRPTAGRG